MSAAPIRKRQRVLLVDDHPIVRRGLTQLINQEDDLVVCGEAVDRTGAMEKINSLRPDLAVVDISLRASDGMDLIKDIKENLPELPVLVLSMHDESVYAERVLRAGARGYIMKQEALEKVLVAIRRILSGEIYLSQEVQTRLVRAVATSDKVPSVSRLTDRELSVFSLFGKGVSSREIAQQLGVSVKTVESHCARIKDKLRLASATELVQCAALWIATEGNHTKTQ